MANNKISEQISAIIKKGVAIPASPLALDANRKFDEKHQRAVYRYYIAAGAGGIAVGVHSTQFEIREEKYNLFKPLLAIASEEMDSLSIKHKRPIVKVAGICGKTKQAVDEAASAVSYGYHAGLLSLSAMRGAGEDEMIAHCKEVAKTIPVIGFYLQPAVGGGALSYSFWRKFAEIENVIAIKMAPFNRYQTIDVVRAVAFAGKENDITLYTGNDDNIIIDLLTPYKIQTPSGAKTLRIKGGLLGQWAVWTKSAVDLLNEIHELIESKKEIPASMLTKNIELTDANSVVFDAANKFSGCIPGIYEVLRRQGILSTNLCLNPHEVLSPGQAEELTRINKDYPWITDDDFVKEHLSEWLK